MGKTASVASAHLAPCPPCACPQAIPVPKNPAVTVSAMMRPEGETSSHLLSDSLSLVSAHSLALTAAPFRFRCACEPGWSGPQCNQSLTRDACESQPCGAGGTCSSYGMAFHCTCPPGVQGTYLYLSSAGSPVSLFLPTSLCSAVFFLYVRICLFSLFPPCSLGGGYEGVTLGGDGNKESLKAFSVCMPTTGRQCELLSPCTLNPCEHGGHCESAPGHLAVCSCPPGWQGM